RVALRYLPNSNLTIDISAVINKVTYDGLQGIAEESFNNGEFSVPLPFQIENFVDSELYIGRIEYNASAFDIISLSSYNEFDALETFDVTGLFGPFNAFLEILTTQENLSQEFRIQSNNSTDSAYRWIAGINYFKTDDLIGQTGITGTPNNRMQSLATLFISGEAENTSAFFSVDMDLGNDFIFTLGGRYSRDDYERISNDGTLFPGSNSAFTPSFTLKYKHSENVLLYSTISKGYRPGSVDISFVDLNPDDQFTSEYDPETAWNYEIGANASLFEGKLVGRANLFFMDYKDIQSVFFIPPSNLSTVTTNGASAEIYGAEIEANVYPSDNLSFDVNLGLLETEFTSFADSPRGDLTGNELPYAPSVTIGINGEYRTKLSDDLEGYVRAEFNRRSSQEGRNDNNPVERQPGYDIVNLRAGVYYANVNIEVYGENVFDEEYFTNRRPGPIVSVTPGSPATWGVRVTATF
ncbi:MAG: TonB-dependent receptor, partial [Pseudomonadota bacterium]